MAKKTEGTKTRAKKTAAEAAARNDRKVTWFGVMEVAASSLVILRENRRLITREIKPSLAGTSDLKRIFSDSL